MKKKGKKLLRKKRGGGDSIPNPEAKTPENITKSTAKAGVKGAKIINKGVLDKLGKLQQVKLYRAGQTAIEEKTLIWFIQAVIVVSLINYFLSRDFLKYQKSEAITYIGLAIGLIAAFGLVFVSIMKEFSDKDLGGEIARILAILKAILQRNLIVWFIIPQLIFAIGITLDNSKFYYLGNYPDQFKTWNNLNVMGLFFQIYIYLRSMIDSFDNKPLNKWVIPLILFGGVITIASEVMLYVLLYLKRVDG